MEILSSTPDDARRVLHRITLHELSPRRASLEEAYMKLTDDSVDYRASQVLS